MASQVNDVGTTSVLFKMALLLFYNVTIVCDQNECALNMTFLRHLNEISSHLCVHFLDISKYIYSLKSFFFPFCTCTNHCLSLCVCVSCIHVIGEDQSRIGLVSLLS